MFSIETLLPDSYVPSIAYNATWMTLADIGKANPAIAQRWLVFHEHGQGVLDMINDLDALICARKWLRGENGLPKRNDEERAAAEAVEREQKRIAKKAEDERTKDTR